MMPFDADGKRASYRECLRTWQKHLTWNKPETDKTKPRALVQNQQTRELISTCFTRMPGESYRRRLGSLLLYLRNVFRAIINFLVC